MFPKVIRFFIKTCIVLISLGKDCDFMPLELHNFEIKTFLIPCYEIIYFKCSCVNIMCKMFSGNLLHEFNSLRFLTVFTKV